MIVADDAYGQVLEIVDSPTLREPGESGFGQVLEIQDSPTLRETGLRQKRFLVGYGQGGYGQTIIGTVDEPIVGGVDPASWGQYIIGTVDKPIVGTTDPASWGQYSVIVDRLRNQLDRVSDEIRVLKLKVQYEPGNRRARRMLNKKMRGARRLQQLVAHYSALAAR